MFRTLARAFRSKNDIQDGLSLWWSVNRDQLPIRGPMPGVETRHPVASSGGSKAKKLNQLPPRKRLDEADLEENFLKGSGPGGQKINKTNSAVQLTHRPTGMVVKCQETRSRDQNRKLARRLLQDKLDQLENGDESRMAVKGAIKAKKKASADKKKRRKYRQQNESVQEYEERLQREGPTITKYGRGSSNGSDTALDPPAPG